MRVASTMPGAYKHTINPEKTRTQESAIRLNAERDAASWIGPFGYTLAFRINIETATTHGTSMYWPKSTGTTSDWDYLPKLPLLARCLAPPVPLVVSHPERK